MMKLKTQNTYLCPNEMGRISLQNSKVWLWATIAGYSFHQLPQPAEIVSTIKCKYFLLRLRLFLTDGYIKFRKWNLKNGSFEIIIECLYCDVLGWWSECGWLRLFALDMSLFDRSLTHFSVPLMSIERASTGKSDGTCKCISHKYITSGRWNRDKLRLLLSLPYRIVQLERKVFILSWVTHKLYCYWYIRKQDG